MNNDGLLFSFPSRGSASDVQGPTNTRVSPAQRLVISGTEEKPFSALVEASERRAQEQGVFLREKKAKGPKAENGELRVTRELAEKGLAGTQQSLAATK